MIDFVKILIVEIDGAELMKSSRLDFKTELNEQTGELSNKHIAEYHHCKVVIFDSGRVYFSGSIHKMYNSLKGIAAPKNYNGAVDKGFNGNLFTLKEILEMKNHISKLVGCQPDQMVFQNLEIGVNTTPDFDPQNIINGLLYHKSKMFEYKYQHNFAQAIHERFILKIYNKSSQYNMKMNVLRVELKIKRSIELKGVGIKTFADINTNTLERASRMLLRRFNEVMYYDCTIKKEELSSRQKGLLSRYSNPRYWINQLRSIHRDREKKKLAEITRNHSEELQKQISENIAQKCVIINRPIKDKRCVTIPPSNIGVNFTQFDPLKMNIQHQGENLVI